ncbi:hypothetical protein EVAR_99124_1 [Eumeta japonica]|uniref:Uncharacterized protein n=1 Tax=Eumeta variegata TaxID=151549 RepID=A0A4C1YTA7_EUMVA|nr:hypothetical protein EVAR_99124_1 [Eumeta japonica]
MRICIRVCAKDYSADLMQRPLPEPPLRYEVRAPPPGRGRKAPSISKFELVVPLGSRPEPLDFHRFVAKIPRANVTYRELFTFHENSAVNSLPALVLRCVPTGLCLNKAQQSNRTLALY